VLAADPPGTSLSRDAIELCHRAQAAAPDEKPALLAQSLARADEAVAADDHDALAYFARFCALGEQARLAGMSLTSLLKVRPLRRAVDETLALAPDFPDALLGKGALLLGLPRILGGDAVEGERLVRRALELDPEYVHARLTLAHTLADAGRRDEAREEASRALAAADRKHDVGDAAEARSLLDDLAR